MEVLSNIEQTESPYVFHNTAGEPISEQTYVRVWNSFKRLMDINAGAKLYRNKVIVHAMKQDLTPYHLRHTFATDLAEKGVDIKLAQYLLGHSDIQTTANIYTHVTPKMLEGARDKMNAKG